MKARNSSHQVAQLKDIGLAKPSSVSLVTIRDLPHDPTAFTQGLSFANGYLYESMGLYGQSAMIKRSAENGTVFLRKELEKDYFAEGSVVVKDKFYLLTWKRRVGWVYDLDFNVLAEFTYATEGWGITFNGTHLVMSDGSHQLFFLDLETREVVHTLPVLDVRDDNGTLAEVYQLNELEFINGMVYANVWWDTRIAVICPVTGLVKQWLLTEAVHKQKKGQEDCLNGIAFESSTQELFITGKKWERIYQVEYNAVAPWTSEEHAQLRRLIATKKGLV